jgi:voltage-gated potassium channel Kch
VGGALCFDFDEFRSFGAALYFSLANFTTVGASDLTIPTTHRMVGALESAAGMLMFGWSTALLVRVVQRTDRSG